MTPLRRILDTLAAVAIASACTAVSAANLTIGLGTDVTALDPHYHNVTPNNNVGAHIFGYLVMRNEKSQLAANRGRYSNTKVDALTEDALQTVDDVKREAYLQRAAELAIGDTGLIPLHFQVSLWATRDGITYAPRVDEQTLAWKFLPRDQEVTASRAADSRERRARQPP